MTGNGAGDGSAAMSPAAVAEQLTTAFKQQQNQASALSHLRPNDGHGANQCLTVCL